MGTPLSRRAVLAGAAAVAGALATGGLSACSDGGKTSGPGTTGADELRKARKFYEGIREKYGTGQ